MLALIDGDIVAYRVGWTTENDDFGIARWRTDEMLDGILIDTGATEFTVFLSDSAENNFRYKIYPEYKANRKSLPRPKHLEELKAYLLTRWGARIAHGQEADDALGIAQVKRTQEDYVKGCVDDSYQHDYSIICSIDKDLQQIPGFHYNFVKKEQTSVSREQGLNYFYRQILVGDTADNIGGCPGIGPVKAGKLLGSLFKEQDLAREVFKAFVQKINAVRKESREEVRAYIEKIGQVLKIRQQEDEPLWHFPLQNLMEEFPSLSTPSKQVETGQSTEPTLQTQQQTNGQSIAGEKTEKLLTTTGPN